MTKPQVLKYDLEERAAKFGENVIKICKHLPSTSAIQPLIVRLVKAATSIGANYVKPTMQRAQKTLGIKSGFAKKKVVNLSTS